MKNTYIGLGLIFGAGIGITAGVLTNNVPIFLSIGAGAGLALGAGFENYIKIKKKSCKAKKVN